MFVHCLRFVWLTVWLGSAIAADRVPVGTYLYANPAQADAATGALTVHFSERGPQLVVAWGRHHRKDRETRDATTEAEREWFKPFKATLAADGKSARFPHLPPDFYDLIVLDAAAMQLWEGLAMQSGADAALATAGVMDTVRATLDRPAGRIAGWDAFFDHKQFDRLETAGTLTAVLVQQLRQGQALAESGDVISGCIHSVDVVWLRRAQGAEAEWQVLQRQQLYRDELPARTFFRHQFCPNCAASASAPVRVTSPCPPCRGKQERCKDSRVGTKLGTPFLRKGGSQTLRQTCLCLVTRRALPPQARLEPLPPGRIWPNVSRGLGMDGDWALRVRFCCRPEITLLELAPPP